jgi:uncharacterized protein (TIGR01319 family)
MANRIMITDIGSTTTKAVLFAPVGGAYELKGMFDTPTTVEKPDEDVRIGVYQAIKGVEAASGDTLLAPGAAPDQLRFPADVTYLTTSSAGGGLQILVVGLTVVDSAASAERAAYGAGGVLLDTFAIDDRRSAIEQMQDMQSLQPDIVLFSGGVDGGAISGLVRLGEILSMAHPRPKYGENRKIPLIFAGNQDAAPLIESLFSDVFELHVVPNLRPSMILENPGPAREEIRRLFMDNVMERAPGYAELKSVVSSPIIPTPFGVMQALSLLAESSGRNILAVDIGGATTDVFSNMMGHMYRTVSASLGMSYNLCEVFANAGWENVRRHLPGGFDEDTVRNYVGNKVLNPTSHPVGDQALAIEHAIAREALRLAREEHLRVNFNAERVGYLDRLKALDRDMSAKLYDTFFVEKQDEKRRFYMCDFNLMIGAGGVLSHAPTADQAFMMIIDGMLPCGLTEIWRDRHFITPHLGKLTEVDAPLAADLLARYAFEPLGWHVKPAFKTSRKPRPGVRVEIPGETALVASTGDFMKIPGTPGEPRRIALHFETGFHIPAIGNPHVLETDQPIYIDLREGADFEQVNAVLGLETFDTPPTPPTQAAIPPIRGLLRREIELPYRGEIRVKPGDQIKSDTLVGEIPFAPPRIYVLSLYTTVNLPQDPELLKSILLIKRGDEVRAGQKLLDTAKARSYLAGSTFSCPVRGRVEEINFKAGVIVLREIQDYSDKPVVVDIAARLAVSPAHIRTYLTRHLNDFVYSGETIAKRLLDKGSGHQPSLIAAPSTGTIVDIDTKKGTLTIRYQFDPYRRYSQVSGRVVEVCQGESATIEFKGEERQGAIGFGGEAAGELCYDDVHATPGPGFKGKILAIPGKVSKAQLEELARIGIAGLIAASADQGDIVEYLGYEIGAAITGKERIPYPIILTGGFGNQFPTPEMNDFLRNATGRHVFIEGRTQIRAGVVRPRIVVLEGESE